MGNYDFDNNHHWEGQELLNGDFDREEPVYVGEPVYEELPANTGTASASPNKAFCTMLLIAINVLVYLKCTGIEHYSATGGANWRDVMERGEYGRLLSSMFLHADFTHLYCNMIALFLFGRSVEEELGSFKLFLIYFIAGIGSGLCSVYLHHDLTNSIGASGAIYALMVVAVFVNIKYLSGSKHIAALTLVLYFIIIVAEIAGTKSAGVDFFAHLAGAVLGAVIALLIFCFQKGRRQEPFVLTILGIGLTLFFSSLAVQEAHLGEVSPWSAERIQFIQEAHLDDIPDISFGEALNDVCTEAEWNAFVSKQEREIVEFNGRCKYGERQEQVLMQFAVDMEEGSYQVSYISLTEKSLTYEEMLDFLREVFSEYGRRHGISVKVNW